jgi:hypothetical protein
MQYTPEQSNAQMDIAKEALRQTELRLEDISGLASSADQRAMALSATLAAITVLLATFAKELPSPLFVYLSSLGLLIAIFLSIRSCLPRDFHVRGHFWSDWYGHIEDNDTLYSAIASQAQENDNRLRENDETLRQSARTLRKAFVIAVYSLCFLIGAQVGSLIG